MELKDVEVFVLDYLSNNLDEKYLFHTEERTKDVVNNVVKILESSNDDNIEKTTLLVTAWFLHTGLIKKYDDPATHSCELVTSFLAKNPIKHVNSSRVCKFIEAVWKDSDYGIPEVHILKDAKTAYFGSTEYRELMELQRMERSQFIDSPLSTMAWAETCLEKLRVHHRFYTKYALENWEEEKQKNIFGLVENIKKLKKTKRKEKLKVELKNQSPERAIQSLYRIQLRNHIKLSDIADTKANILLSVNAIIISLLLANLIPTLDNPDNSYLIYPTSIFILFSIASMILSVLATRPKIDNSQLVDGDISDKEMNYLFFGNFYALKLSDFKKKISGILANKDTIYESLTMDLYYLGQVLKKKYELLRWTYTIFIVGIILSVLAFAIALKYFGMEDEIIDAVTPDAN